MKGKSWVKPAKGILIWILTVGSFSIMLQYTLVPKLHGIYYQGNPAFTSSLENVTLEDAIKTDLGISTQEFWGKEQTSQTARQEISEAIQNAKSASEDATENAKGLETLAKPLYKYPSGVMLKTSGALCTTGFLAKSYNTPVLVTAKHCLPDTVIKDSLVSAQISDTVEVTLGNLSAKATFGDVDIAILPIAFKDNSYMQNAYSDSDITPSVDTIKKQSYHSLTNKVSPVKGEPVCSYGKTSGWRCGMVTEYNSKQHLVKTDFCSRGGDSGGPLFSARGLVGVLSVSYLLPGDRLHCEDGRRAPNKGASGFVSLTALPDTVVFK